MSLTLQFIVALVQATSVGCPLDSDRPLFECDQVLELELELPLKTLKRKAEDRPELAAKVRYVDANGELVEFDAEVTTRGHSRLEMCRFPPLSLLLKKKAVKDTVFAGQKKLKIVMPCKAGNRYDDYLLQEYGIYKAYEVVADPAFRVRRLNITFRDAGKPDKTESHAAFFIESIKEVSVRTGLERVRENRVDPHRIDARNASTYELFQFLIANTDWSKIKGPGDEECCHNGKVLAPPGSESGWFVLPYDFDQAGLINTRYAAPDERLPIRSVRQRLFRGRCEYLHVMDDTIALFNDNRSAIENALAVDGLSDNRREAQARYVYRFFEIINDPGEREKHISERCVGPR